MGGTPAPKETAPVVTPEQQAADAAKVEVEKKQAVAKEAQKNSARSSLQALRDSIKLPAPAGAETSEVTPKVPKFKLPFTRDGQQAFLDVLISKAKESLSAETDEAKKDRLSKLYAGSVLDDFIAKFLPNYYFLLADGVDGDIALDVDVDDAGKVTIATKEQPKVDAAKKIAEDKAKEAVANMDQPAEIQRFQKDHPEAFLFLNQVVFGNDAAKMKAAFAGTGLLGFFLGMLGYGGGKSMYSSIMKSEWFSKYYNSTLDSLAKLGEETDFRDPIELAKASDLDEYYKNLPQNELRIITRRFVVKNEIKLPEVTTFGSIVFPKGSGNASLAGASKEGTPLTTSFKRDEKYKNITVPKDTKIEAGTVFYSLTIGDKAKIEAAQQGAPAAEVEPVAAAPKPEVAAAPPVQPAAAPAAETTPPSAAAPAAPAAK